MNELELTSFRLSGDLSFVELGLLCLLVVGTWGLLAFEMRRAARGRAALFATGALGATFLGLAVARPVRVEERGSASGARVVVLVDASSRLELEADGGETRKARARATVRALTEHFAESRLEVHAFGDGELFSIDDPTPRSESDLASAIDRVVRLPGERPAAIVVVSDGRLATPAETDDVALVRQALDRVRGEIPLHTVALTSRVPRDRSIVAVRTTGSAVAHQPLALSLSVGCRPVDACPPETLIVRELLEGEGTRELARGQVEWKEGSGVLELPVTLDRAGSRVLEVTFASEPSDEVPENDRRFVAVDVRRDRMRILHVAGRPTYDVRALRTFLKGDESIDLVSFFILRTLSDRVGASESDLALIPFPVEELFTEHLPSFDAIILQDIDAREYDLDRHFEGMRDYVRRGGGLILVGGPGAFAGGGYAASPLEEVMPVRVPVGREAFSQKVVVPRPTRVGTIAPVLRGLRDSLGDRPLPEMAGANLLGAPREGALVLWEHPTLEAAGSPGQPMPLLALSEAGDGRSIALGLDATHELRFGKEGAETLGRAHTALFEGLLGWLMRDPRFEAARIEKSAPCFAGHPLEVRVTPLPTMGETARMSLVPLARATSAEEIERQTKTGPEGRPLTFSFEKTRPGGYVARAEVGLAPPTRLVFACEEGGGTWSDSRPDPARLELVAEASGGRAVTSSDVTSLPEPPRTLVLAESATVPWLPDWLLASIASLVLGLHFLLRRSGGFA